MKIRFGHKFVVFIAIMLYSCVQNQDKTEIKEHTTYINGNKEIKLDFKDSITVSEVTSGILYYNKNFDTLNLADIDKRYIYMHLKSESTTILSFEEIKSRSDWLYVDSLDLSGEFKFRMVSDEIGYNVINLAIEDIIFLKESVDGKVRVLSSEVTIAKDIYVKPIPLIKNNNG